jgi:DNA-directed RNA polymerase subunit L
MFSKAERIDKHGLAYKFRLSPLHVSYANALRRIITSHVETVAFRADMTDKGTTSDVSILRNDTPMSNEMLAERVGLLPINVKDPLNWKPELYQFSLKVENTDKDLLDVKAADFIVTNKETGEQVPTTQFFPPDPRSGDTSLIAILRPASYLQGINLKKQTGGEKKGEQLEIYATATIGNGRQHCRFSPVTCCVFPYTRDDNPDKVTTIFRDWLVREKKISYDGLEADKETILRREFDTMAIARSYLTDNRGEPISYDVMIESVGVLTIDYIMQRACEIGKQMFAPLAGIETGDLPDFITVSPTKKEMLGFDFHLRDQDAHTIGNSLQTWIVDNIIDGDGVANEELKITFAGYDEGHPLDNVMTITIGVGDGKESSARKAIAMAARGCISIFQRLHEEWINTQSAAPVKTVAVAPTTKKVLIKRRTAPTASGVSETPQI